MMLVSLRDRLGLTQTEMAAMLGVHPMTVSKWERGAGESPPYHRQQIEEAVRGETFLSSEERALVRRLAQDGHGVRALALVVLAGCDER